MNRAPTLLAVELLVDGNGSAAAIQAAATTVVEALQPVIKKIVRAFYHNRLLNRIMARDDMTQECVTLVLTRVVNRFELPEDVPQDDDKRVRRTLGGLARTVLSNHWRDRLRHGDRNRALMALTQQSIRPTKALFNKDRDYRELEVCWTDAVGAETVDRHDHEDIFGVLRGGLTPSDYLILTMRYEGRSTTEIGRFVGMTRKGVQQRIRTKIRPVLAPLLAASGLEVPGQGAGSY